MKILIECMCVVVLAGCAAEAPEGSFVQSETGVVVTPAQAESRRVRLEVRTDRIVRVTSVNDRNLDLPKSLMVVALECFAAVHSRWRSAMATSCSKPRSSSRACRWRMAPCDSPTAPASRCSPKTSTPRARAGRFAALQSGNGRSVLRLGPAPERADESQRRRRRARAAQHGHRRAVRGVDAQLRRAMGQQRHHAPRQSEALWPCVARSQDPRCGGQGRRLHRALLHRRTAQARARREGHQLPVHPRPLQLAEGTAHGQGAAHRLAA